MNGYNRMQREHAKTAIHVANVKLVRAQAELEQAKETISGIATAVNNPALDMADKLDLVQSILTDWNKQAADAAMGQV